MKKNWIISLFGAVILLVTQFHPVLADGIIIPPPIPPCPPGHCPTVIPGVRLYFPLEVKYHHVDVKINDQLAETHVDQVFYNPTDQPVEGTYVFPLPLDAAVSDFTLWVDGEPVKGEVLNAEQAREIYENIVRSQRDPALLEYVGRGAVQASVFPIPPQGERRIELSYSQVLTSDNGLVNYIYPLNTEKFSSKPLDSVSVNVEITSQQPIRAVYSSSHQVDIQRPDDNTAGVSFEAYKVKPDTDFNLFYSIGEAEAFHVISYRNPGDALDRDGYFMALLAPKPGAGEVKVAKDLILVLDRSGSMDGEKIQQAKSAVTYILKHLNPEDRFQIITFSSALDRFADHLQPASEANRAEDWVAGISASGSTDINRALLEAAAMADKERPTYLIFLTDGLPTEGVMDTQDILKNFAQMASENLRLFSFGVGFDVDTMLLDSISRDHHGLSSYIREGQSLDEVLSTFYSRISTPVLTNLKLTYNGISTSEIYPNPLPDLFAGNQVVIAGRYSNGGRIDVKLTGEVNSEKCEFVFTDQNFEVDSRLEKDQANSLPRLWATRKIGNLLSQIRLNGPDKETIDQIVKLSVRFGIVTPYTSYLVTEPVTLGVENQQRVAQDAYQQMLAQPTMAASGPVAVEKAAEQGAMSQADIAPAPPAARQDTMNIQYSGAKTFVLQDGVWMDTTYDPEKMTPVKVAFLSPDYFRLAKSSPEIGSALALGERMVIVVDGQAIEIVAEGTDAPILELKPVEKITPTATAGVEETNLPTAATPKPTLPITDTPGGTPTSSTTGIEISPWVWLGGFVALVGLGGFYLIKWKG